MIIGGGAPMIKCSLCQGVRVDGCIAHTPLCPCYSPKMARKLFDEHPDLVAIEITALWLYPSDVWPDARP